MSYHPLRVSPEEKELLRARFLETPEVMPLSADPKFLARVVSLGIQQEIGTIHDELSKFLFDGRTGERIPRDRLRAELIESAGYSGVRIWAEGIDRLDPRVRGLRALLHPGYSLDAQGHVRQCVLFPEIIARIAALGGGELVSVRPWVLNTVFGGFDPGTSYYEGNMFEFINLDAIRYSRLLERRQIAFFGTHDLVSHVAGIRRSAWPELEERGKAARILFEEYFEGVRRPVPVTLVLPYALGMLLDDLAQPMNYDSASRRHVVQALMGALRSRRIPPDSTSYLLRYPPSLERLILLARADDAPRARERAAGLLEDIIAELRSSSVVRKAS